MEESELGYFSGDQIPVFICELLLGHRLSGNVFGLLSLGEGVTGGMGWWVDGGVGDGVREGRRYRSGQEEVNHVKCSLSSGF